MTAYIDGGGSAFPSPPIVRNLGTADEQLQYLGELGADGMSLRVYAAIHLRVPNSGVGWIDEMICHRMRDDFAGQAMATLVSECTVQLVDDKKQPYWQPDTENFEADFIRVLAPYAWEAADRLLDNREDEGGAA